MTAERRGRVAVAIVAAVAVVVAAVVAFSIGRVSALGDGPPDTSSAEAGFARDMQTHHDQGVELAMIVRDRTDDEDVRLLAYDIATTQGQQSGQLYGWLSEWGLSQAGSEPPMTWMTRSGSGHSHGASSHEPGAPMPGLATPAQIAELQAASGADAERLFLELMIAHHRGAIEMAEAYLDRGDRPTVAAFARNVVRSQDAEIALMESMLADRA